VKAAAVVGNEGLLKVTRERSSARSFASFSTREAALESLAQR